MRSACSCSGNGRASADCGAWTARTGRSKSISRPCAPTSSNAAVSMPAKRPPKRPTSIDVAVGRNVRIWRMAKGLSQAQLAHRLGVTFQQVQKYEVGANRIGTGRLVKLAAILGIPIAALFDGTEGRDPARSLLALIADKR